MTKISYIDVGMGVRKHKMKAEEVNFHLTIFDSDRKSLEAYNALMAQFQKLVLKELQIPMKMVKSWEALSSPPEVPEVPKKDKASEGTTSNKTPKKKTTKDK